MTEHRTTYTPIHSGKSYAAVCSCGWWGEDFGDAKSAREQADKHGRGEREPYEAEKGKVWSPTERPFPGT